VLAEHPDGRRQVLEDRSLISLVIDETLRFEPTGSTEGQVALDELLNRFPEWDVDLDRAALAPTFTVRGWETLPLVIP
jgi:cytochrome P450